MFELIDDSYKIGFLHASEEIFLSSENFPKISINNNYENSVNYIKYLLFIIATCSRLRNSSTDGDGSNSDNKSKNIGSGSSNANTPGSSANTPSSGNIISYGISGHGSTNFSSSMDISSKTDNSNNNNKNKEETTASDCGSIALSDSLVFSLNLSLEKLIYYCLKLEKKRFLNNNLATTKNSSIINSNITNSNITPSTDITPTADTESGVSLPEPSSVSGATMATSSAEPIVISNIDKRNNNIQQLKLEQNLERAIILLVRIILIHKKFLIELIIKRSVNLQTDVFLINLVKLINCKIIQENFKLKSLLYDVLISIKTCISESINNLNKQNNPSNGNNNNNNNSGNSTGGNNNNNINFSGSSQLPTLASNNLSISSLSINRGTPTSSSFLSPANSPMAPPQINLTPNSRSISSGVYYSNNPNTPTHQQFGSNNSQQQQGQGQGQQQGQGQHGSFQHQPHLVQQQQIQQFQQQISGIINISPPGYGGGSGDDGRINGMNGTRSNGSNGSNGNGNNRLIHLLKPLMIKYGFKNGLIINHDTFNLSSKFFVYDNRNDNYLLFNFQRFELIEDANPNIGINDSSISLQYFNSCIERKNPK
ncbi:unnamed protein product [[Candida] boidinii]|uniref:Unnamed protein product n=1 Tax=Candida boidinii TaxID=5477 RepID=A0ACB5TKJ0_CANBO|nr:unnamed protein product [[Candida] boidinii]